VFSVSKILGLAVTEELLHLSVKQKRRGSNPLPLLIVLRPAKKMVEKYSPLGVKKGSDYYGNIQFSKKKERSVSS
jgi:hypothetical protein